MSTPQRKKKGLKAQEHLNGEVIGIAGSPVAESSFRVEHHSNLDSVLPNNSYVRPFQMPPPPPFETPIQSSNFIEREFEIPKNASPGMAVTVHIDGNEAKFKLPHTAKPGMKIKIKVKKKSLSTQANLAHDTHRAIDDRGNFIRPQQIYQAAPTSATDVVNNVRNEASRLFGRSRNTSNFVTAYFRHWQKWEMCEILVRKDIELKDIANLNLSRLRAACGKVFKHEIIAGNIPERPNKLPLTKVLYIETLVRKVQERWFALRAAKAPLFERPTAWGH